MKQATFKLLILLGAIYKNPATGQLSNFLKKKSMNKIQKLANADKIKAEKRSKRRQANAQRKRNR